MDKDRALIVKNIEGSMYYSFFFLCWQTAICWKSQLFLSLELIKEKDRIRLYVYYLWLHVCLKSSYYIFLLFFAVFFPVKRCSGNFSSFLAFVLKAFFQILEYTCTNIRHIVSLLDPFIHYIMTLRIFFFCCVCKSLVKYIRISWLVYPS